MNKFYSSAVIMAMISLVACNKEGVQTVGETLSANAYISPETKTDYVIGNYGEKAGVKVTWSEAETFKAYYTGGAEPVIFSKTAAGTSFTAESVPSGVTSSTKFTGLYGSKATLNSDGKIDIDFSRQNGEADNLAAYDVMTDATPTLSEGMLSFAFKHNCAILRLKCVNYTQKEVNFVILDFAKAEVIKEFASTGFDQSRSVCIRLKLKLDKPVAKDTEEANGVEEVRYVMVPAMNYCESMPDGLPRDDDSGFHKSITFYENKFIEAGKVYDVLCEYGFKGGIVEAD